MMNFEKIDIRLEEDMNTIIELISEEVKAAFHNA